MAPLSISLHWKQLGKIAELVEYEEPRVIRRANILSCLHNDMTSGLIAKVLNVNPKTVRNVAHTFNESGLDAALYDDERSGRPIDFDDKDRSRIVAMVCSDPPRGFYRWTLDLIVDEAKKRQLVEDEISREQIRIILQEHDLKPWQEKMWCISELDDEFIERMEDILDVYERPYDKANPVICVDEKPVPMIADKRERIPAEPGSTRKIDYEYERNGSVNVFVGVEPKVGRYFNEVTERRCAPDFAKFLKTISESYPDANQITLVMDNLSTHSEKSLVSFLGETAGKQLWQRFDVHFTPKHASWLNQAEIAIGMYSRQCLGDGRVGNIKYLKAQTSAWNKRTNKKAPKIQWRFTKTKARKSLGYQTKSAA
ncbi:MAG: IS630 family transposase [Bdellovibrionales bacterium]|nr:IS630 family transposase [Bdellovibrionales bacterium]